MDAATGEAIGPDSFMFGDHASNARLLGATGTEFSHQAIIFPKTERRLDPGERGARQ
jgi:hypothetical protein